MFKHEWKREKAMWEEKVEDIGAQTGEGDPRGPFSFSVAYVNRIVSVQEFKEDTVEEAEEILEDMAKQYKLDENSNNERN